MPTDLDLYRSMYRIRRFEEMVMENFPRGVFFGTTHTYLGQEANAAGILVNLQDSDIVFSNHRCHGHFLAYGGDMRALFAELMGRATGVCAGRGGSQHLQWRNFYSNGVQGGIVPVATGMALAEKSMGHGTVTLAFIGDGTLGEGVLYESLNLASLWSAPILYVIENNHIAQTTPVELALAGSIRGRFEAFGIPVLALDSSDVQEISVTAGEIISQVRAECRPSAFLLHTCRFGPHSKGDDTRVLAEVSRMREARDPLRIHGVRLAEGLLAQVEREIDEEVNIAYRMALEDPFPTQSVK